MSQQHALPTAELQRLVRVTSGGASVEARAIELIQSECDHALAALVRAATAARAKGPLVPDDIRQVLGAEPKLAWVARRLEEEDIARMVQPPGPEPPSPDARVVRVHPAFLTLHAEPDDPTSRAGDVGPRTRGSQGAAQGGERSALAAEFWQDSLRPYV